MDDQVHRCGNIHMEAHVKQWRLIVRCLARMAHRLLDAPRQGSAEAGATNGLAVAALGWHGHHPIQGQCLSLDSKESLDHRLKIALRMGFRVWRACQ